MIQYTSTISIYIKNFDPEKISQIKNRLNIEACEFFPDGRLHLIINIKTVGTPDASFPDFAQLIWWGNDGFCDIEFFISDSSLSYSSPTIFSQTEFELRKSR